MRIQRKVGPKGQIVIPKVVRDYLGIKPGDIIMMEIREREIIITSPVDPRNFVEDFCSTVKKKLTKKIDLEELVESEIGERFTLR